MIETKHANKLWGRGRIRQLAVRWWHNHIIGHDWTAWHYDWPEDVSEPPEPHQLLLWLRGCSSRDCGTVQTGHACLIEAHRLPGRTRGALYDPATPTHD